MNVHSSCASAGRPTLASCAGKMRLSASADFGAGAGSRFGASAGASEHARAAAKPVNSGGATGRSVLLRVRVSGDALALESRVRTAPGEDLKPN
jgi:hypothetical protein